MNHYDVLNITATASKEEIKQSYKILVKRYHPDLNKEDTAKEDFIIIHEAYLTLINKEKKKIYDEFLKMAIWAGEKRLKAHPTALSDLRVAFPAPGALAAFLRFPARVYSNSLESGGDYKELPRTVIISIIDFPLLDLCYYYG